MLDLLSQGDVFNLNDQPYSICAKCEIFDLKQNVSQSFKYVILCIFRSSIADDIINMQIEYISKAVDS